LRYSKLQIFPQLTPFSVRRVNPTSPPQTGSRPPPSPSETGSRSPAPRKIHRTSRSGSAPHHPDLQPAGI